MRRGSFLSTTHNNAGSKNLKANQSMKGREYLPDFEYQAAGLSKKKVLLTGLNFGLDRLFKVPYMTDGVLRTEIIFDDWTIDLDATAINLTTFTGGIISGSLSDQQSYLLWMFVDPTTLEFKGLGASEQPIAAISATSGGGFGALTTFTVGPNAAFAFNVGARVIARVGNPFGAAYNQGIVTSITNGTTIVVTLDASYGLPNESNSVLAGGGMTLIQVAGFAPKLSTEDSLYPGSGEEYAYRILGSLQINDVSEICHVRHLGEPWLFLIAHTALDKTVLVTTTFELGLGRHVPIDSRYAILSSQAVNTNSTGLARSAILHNKLPFIIRTSNTAISGVNVVDTGTVAVCPHDSSIETVITLTEGANGRTIVGTLGFLPNEAF